jgi:hypothetical protein
MKTKLLALLGCLGILVSLLGGCAAPIRKDYTNFRFHQPRSILVLPPLNLTTAVEGTYGYLSTVTLPLAEMGYYVYPVSVVDQFMKENGLPTAGEMHQVPVRKFYEVFGADAVLYTTVVQYGSKYRVISSITEVSVDGRLVDTRSGITLWEGMGSAIQSAGGTGNPIADAIAATVGQIIGSSTDQAHQLCRWANFKLLVLENNGILYGPYSPRQGEW